MISEQEFLKTELDMGISLQNPSFVALGRATAQQIADYTDIRTVLDYGAGVGAYAAGFLQEGFDVIMWEKFQAHKEYLKKYLPTIPIVDKPETTDLLAWIEVAEHMTDQEIDTLLKTIFPKYILFSSTSETTPNDAAWGHINVKSQEQWVELFDKYGYRLEKQLTIPTPWTKLFRR